MLNKNIETVKTKYLSEKPKITRRSFCHALVGTSVFVASKPMLFNQSARAIRQASTTPLLDRLKKHAAYLFNHLKQKKLPGVLIGIQQADLPAIKLSFGHADVYNKIPLQLEMTMRIGSIAKLLVGAAALKIADEAKIDLSQHVSEFRSDVPNGKQITIRMLGNHTSGLYNLLRSSDFRKKINKTPKRQFSREELLTAAFAQTQATHPGRSFIYSNTNTILLADILEKVTGQDIQTILQNRILKPLGLTNTYIPSDAKLKQPAPRGYRFGRAKNTIEYGDVFFDATEFNASWADAAGNLNSTLDDLLKLAKPLAAGEGLSAKSRAKQTNFIKVGSGFEYGFCLARYGAVIGHSGDVPGFSSFAAWEPEQDITIAVLSNLSNFADKSSPATVIGTKLFAQI